MPAQHQFKNAIFNNRLHVTPIKVGVTMPFMYVQVQHLDVICWLSEIVRLLPNTFEEVDFVVADVVVDEDDDQYNGGGGGDDEVYTCLIMHTCIAIQ